MGSDMRGEFSDVLSEAECLGSHAMGIHSDRETRRIVTVGGVYVHFVRDAEASLADCKVYSSQK